MATFSEDRVKEIIAKELEVETKQLTPEAKFIEDLGADSLDIVELVMALEEEFGIDIPDEDADKLKTVGDAMNYLKSHADGVTDASPRTHRGRRHRGRGIQRSHFKGSIHAGKRAKRCSSPGPA